MDVEPSSRARWRALGGAVGPVAFVTAWSVLGAVKPGYSPVRDPISELAAVDASTRIPMTLGFLAFGTGVAIYAGALRKALPGGAAAAALATAAATVGVALLPLGASFGDGPHGVAAGLGYATLAATPLLGARAFAADGHRSAAVASLGGGLAAAAALAATAVVHDQTGLLQRAGLLAGDAWLVATAVWLARRQHAGAVRSGSARDR